MSENKSLKVLRLDNIPSKVGKWGTILKIVCNEKNSTFRFAPKQRFAPLGLTLTGRLKSGYMKLASRKVCSGTSASYGQTS